MEMGIEYAAEILQLRKGQVARMVFSEDFLKTIDFALPQEWIKENQKKFQLHRFWLVTDCSKAVPEVIDMRQFFAPEKVEALIELARITRAVREQRLIPTDKLREKVQKIEAFLPLIY